VIADFACRKTERLWQRRRDHGLPPQIERVALRKLTQLDRSRELRDLSLPPGNRLEALRGNRSGQHSIPRQRPMARLLPLARRRRARR